ncbi:hypothetical protein KZX46_02695 (plasmid) [Polymorphobacter sp. PAMC 29334]|nr:hypothetical protein [Polymorphobacter sp. PAMC 29334]QYE33054.1 hypothetical protein KZX46_02695 [Polymorphobacter sp. PAMC 29334]
MTDIARKTCLSSGILCTLNYDTKIKNAYDWLVPPVSNASSPAQSPQGR